jgi:hypothetical protein
MNEEKVILAPKEIRTQRAQYRWDGQETTSQWWWGPLWCEGEASSKGWGVWNPVYVRGGDLARVTENRARGARYRWDVWVDAIKQWWGHVGCARDGLKAWGGLEPGMYSEWRFGARSQKLSRLASISAGRTGDHQLVMAWTYMMRGRASLKGWGC